MGFWFFDAATKILKLSAGIAMAASLAPLSAKESQAPDADTPAVRLAKGGTADRIAILGEQVYPRADLGAGDTRFDPASTLLVNALGAKSGMFGAAARDGVTWANAYVPGTDRSGVVQLYSLSTTGNYGAFFGARSSDNPSGQAENVIGSIDLVVADSAQPHLHWAHYSEGYVPAGKRGYRLLINDENSIQNDSDPAPSADPYNVNPQHLLNNLRVDCGIGMQSANSCTNPLSILNNGASYRVGILFGDRSIDVVNGAANAVALPSAYALSWFGQAGNPSWRIYAQARRANAGRVVMTDAAMTVAVGDAATPGLQVAQNFVATPAVIASGAPPAISGNCPVTGQRGGSTAGVFAFAADCPAGRITIHIAAAAPTGWACFASNLDKTVSVVRETAFDQTSATMDVSNAESTDSVVFSCNGF